MNEPDQSAVVLRGFRPADIAFAHHVRQLAGWNQTEQDWRGYLAFEPEGCFIAEVNGRPAGTATTTRYGGRFGWIGMVLVHPDHRRLGVGTQLLRHAIGYLQGAEVSSIKLDATPMGKKVYVPLGFADEYEISRYEGVAGSGPGDPGGGRGPKAVEPVFSSVGRATPPAPLPETAAQVSRFLPADLEAVALFDGPVFGADRAPVIQTLRGRNPDWCFVAREGSEVTGYLIAREGANAVQIGPWVARDRVSAASLLRALFYGVPGRRVFVDVPAPNPAGADLMRQHGFVVQRTLTRMVLGQNAHPGTPLFIYSTGGPEKG